jgi:hypothetical protein
MEGFMTRTEIAARGEELQFFLEECKDQIDLGCNVAERENHFYYEKEDEDNPGQPPKGEELVRLYEVDTLCNNCFLELNARRWTTKLLDRISEKAQYIESVILDTVGWNNGRQH